MKKKALVVEDDPQDFAIIEDALVSLGHEFAWVKNQRDAEKALEMQEFDYVLLDLTIPARAQRSKPNPEYCLNFLDNLQQRCGPGRVPVIILADRTVLAPDMIRDMIDLGAVEFVGKPFSAAGRRLSMVICKVLRGGGRLSLAVNGVLKGLPPFNGGDLVLYADHAELCGVRIISDRGAGQCLQILEELHHRDAHGRYVRRSAGELADAIQALGGIGTVVGCIRRIRDNIVKRLERERGVACGRDEVIQNNEQGYSLRDWIKVHNSAEQPRVAAAPRVAARRTVRRQPRQAVSS